MSQMKKTNNVSKTATFFVFCKAEEGKPLYIKDVRKWMAYVDELKLDDNVELEGGLYLALDIDEPALERISCGECDSDDFLVTVHNCEEETAKRKAEWAKRKTEEET
jgi:hypothetical protein